jgi:hypothetical protein
MGKVRINANGPLQHQWRRALSALSGAVGANRACKMGRMGRLDGPGVVGREKRGQKMAVGRLAAAVDEQMLDLLRWTPP